MKVLKCSLFFLMIISFALALNAHGATYYCSPSGSGSTCSNPSPCSLSTGLGKLTAGDTLYLKDGSYYSTLSVPTSGTSGSYITIEAENDGQAIINGQGVRRACYVNGKSYVNVEGIICKNSNNMVFEVNNSSYINLRRVSANNVAVSGNYHTFGIYYSNHILLEDCAAYGAARVLYNIYENQYTTLRRCYGRYSASPPSSGTPYVIIQIYGTDNSIIENCVGVRQAGSGIWGLNLWANTYNPTCNSNKMYGNVMYGTLLSDYYINSETSHITDNDWQDNVGFNGINGFLVRADYNGSASHMTLVNQTSGSNGALELDNDSDQPNTKLTIKNSSFANNSGYGMKRIDSILNHSYNNFYNNSAGNYSGTSAGTGETTTNPNYDTATYGKGAYLMVPSALQGQGEGGADTGAQVLYRYQNGKLTATPLWPWPMEDRIMAETGFSVTYESGGGLWKTLSGVYAGTPPPPPTDTVKPSPPVLKEVI